ncbi:MAG TPA: hypothetical protein VN033_01200 [Vulgatibacter sp.]|nr:hypothetical protein [Vulgatibacter sp.]
MASAFQQPTIRAASSRPYGKNSFALKPSAVIGTSPGTIGTAVGQQHLRSILSYVNSPELAQPEVYLQFKPGLITDDGEITNDSTRDFPVAAGVRGLHPQGGDRRSAGEAVARKAIPRRRIGRWTAGPWQGQPGAQSRKKPRNFAGRFTRGNTS